MPSIGCWVNFSFFKFDVDFPIVFYMPRLVAGVLDFIDVPANPRVANYPFYR